jgi:predicted N-acetyltransferase YhbS
MRKETEKDYAGIKSVNDKAFGQENEGKTVSEKMKNIFLIYLLSLK